MSIRPSGAVVFVNNDLTSNVQSFIVKQLHITEVIDGYTFDARIASDSDYLTKLCQLDLRIMVVRSFDELENRSLASVVIFVSHGLAAILENKLGPPGLTFPVVDLTWGKLCVFN